MKLCVYLCAYVFLLRSCAETATLFGCDCHGCCLDNLRTMIEPIKAKSVASVEGAQSSPYPSLRIALVVHTAM
eukprot:6193816-Pleurochrysis_carterae.AAC.3